MVRWKALCVAIAGMAIGSLLVVPTGGPAVQAALPQLINGIELTRFAIDGDPTGPDDWNDPYTGGTTPFPGAQSTGMLPIGAYPDFSTPDYPTSGTAPAANPAAGLSGQPATCTDPAVGLDDTFLAGATLADIRIDNPVIGNSTNVRLGCGTPPATSDLLRTYASTEIIWVPDETVPGGTRLDLVVYGAWQRPATETGDVSLFVPMRDDVAGPDDGSGQPSNSVGDLIIAFHFDPDGGLNRLTYDIWRWNPNSAQWYITLSGRDGQESFDAAVGTGNGQTFGEFAFNLRTSDITAQLMPACRTYRVADYVFSADARPADPTQTTFTDYVDSDGIAYSPCGSLEVEATRPFDVDVSADHGYEVRNLNGLTIFGPGAVPVTTPTSSSNRIRSTITSPPSATPYPTNITGNPQVFGGIIGRPGYVIQETTVPDPWVLDTLECTYPDISSPILDAGGAPTGQYDTVTTIFDGVEGHTEFVIPPVLDVDMNGQIEQSDIEAMRASCVITNTANAITIVKDAVPDAASTDFDFTWQRGTDAPQNFTLNDPSAPAKSYLVTQGDDHTIVELDTPLFWDATSASCDTPTGDPQVTWTQSAGPQIDVTIGNGPVRHVTCTFVNTGRPQPYQMLVTPGTSHNLLGDGHEFVVEVRSDADDDGDVDQSVIGATVQLDWSGPSGSAIGAVNGTATGPTNSTTCTTQDGSDPAIPAGTCTISVSSPSDAGAGSLTASFSVPDPWPDATELPTGDPSTNCTNPTVEGGVITVCNAAQNVQRIEDSATKTWITLQADVTDPDVALTGVDHDLTITATYDDGSGPAPLPDGSTIAYAWSGAGAPSPAGQCVTSGGSCDLTASSDVPGTGTLTIGAVTTTIGSTTFNDATPAPSSGGSLAADAGWIAFDVDITPQASLNPVGEPHTFTISARVDDGAGLTPLATPTDSGSVDWTYDAPDVADDDSGSCTLQTGGECTIDKTSASSGVGTVTATALDVTYGGVAYGPIDLTAGGDGQSSSLELPPTATKIWGGYTLTVDPLTTSNLWPSQGDQVIVLTLESDPSDLPIAGQDIDVTLSSTAAQITGVTDGSFAPTTASCTTDVDGACSVTVTADEPGTAVLSAEYVADIGGEQTPFPAADDAELSWSGYRVRVTPSSNEHLVATSRTFTVAVEWNDAGAGWTPVVGAVPTIGRTGVGTVTAHTCGAGTDASGTCTATVTSAAAGLTTLVATYQGTFGNESEIYTGEGTKRWISYRVVVTPAVDDNLVNTTHTFAVYVQVNRGNGYTGIIGVKPTVNVSGKGSRTGGTCSSATGSNGACTVTVRSGSPGTTTLDATYTGSAADGGSRKVTGRGIKRWVNYRLRIDPPQTTHLAGQSAAFVATLEVDTGSGFVPARNATIRFTSSGNTGSITSSRTCTTANNGTCRATVKSSSPGRLNLRASYSANVSNTSRTFTATAQENWIPSITLPATGTDPRRFVQIAIGITLAGLALLVVAVRRRPRTT